MEWLPLVFGRYFPCGADFFSGTPPGDPACYPLYGPRSCRIVNARKIKTMLHEDKRFRHIRVSVNPPGWEKITMKNCWRFGNNCKPASTNAAQKRRLFQFREDFNMNGSQQICFTDSAGKALFSIPDNGLLCLFYGNGDRHFAVCHRLDDTHAEIDGVNYSLPDFAKG